MPEYHGDDIYCDLVIPGELPVKVVAETDEALAFHHTKPYWPVHIVVVPKRHVDSLLELDDALAEDLLSLIKQVVSKVKGEHGACRVLTNLGEYQDSKHLHFHISSGEPLRH